MRYVKVLFLVLLFFLVMMFFVQNQGVFSQAMSMKLDLLFTPPMESAPLPFYTLLLVCFLLGALCTLLMLIWDRLSMSAKLTMANMRIRSLERELQKTGKAREAIESKVIDAESRAADAETRAADAETRAAEAEARVAGSAVPAASPVE